MLKSIHRFRKSFKTTLSVVRKRYYVFRVNDDYKLIRRNIFHIIIFIRFTSWSYLFLNIRNCSLLNDYYKNHFKHYTSFPHLVLIKIITHTNENRKQYTRL